MDSSELHTRMAEARSSVELERNKRKCAEQRAEKAEAARDTAIREMTAYARRCGDLEAQLCGQLMEHPGRKAMLLVLAELRRAKLKYPVFARDLDQALDVLDEERDELVAAALKEDINGVHGVIHEAAQVAAVAIRIVEMAQALEASA